MVMLSSMRRTEMARYLQRNFKTFLPKAVTSNTYASATTAVLAPIMIQSPAIPDQDVVYGSMAVAPLVELALAPLALAMLALAIELDALAIAILFCMDADAPVAPAKPSLVIVLIMLDIDIDEFDDVELAAINAAQEVKFMLPRKLLASSASHRWAMCRNSAQTVELLSQKLAVKLKILASPPQVSMTVVPSYGA